jgi:drug/metabolite transporter (DMT)-like permease
MIPSGQAAVLGFTMPLWSALISRFVLGERLKPRMLVALALGAAAVGLLMMRNIGVYAEAPLGLVMGLTAGLGWAIGTLVLKRRPIGAPALVLTGWQSLLAGVPISVAAIALGEGPAFMPSLTTIAVIGYIILVPMCIGNFCWFSIVGLLPANLAGLSSVLVPVVAMISGAIVLGEPLGPLQWLAMICIATALSLALLRPERT